MAARWLFQSSRQFVRSGGGAAHSCLIPEPLRRAAGFGRVAVPRILDEVPEADQYRANQKSRLCGNDAIPACRVDDRIAEECQRALRNESNFGPQDDPDRQIDSHRNS